jgi:flavin-dependent dehydrogenase
METYDVIVIGAGPAGLMAARELEKYPVNYMIIETKSAERLPGKTRSLKYLIAGIIHSSKTKFRIYRFK